MSHSLAFSFALSFRESCKILGEKISIEFDSAAVYVAFYHTISFSFAFSLLHSMQTQMTKVSLDCDFCHYCCRSAILEHLAWINFWMTWNAIFKYFIYFRKNSCQLFTFRHRLSLSPVVHRDSVFLSKCLCCAFTFKKRNHESAGIFATGPLFTLLFFFLLTFRVSQFVSLFSPRSCIWCCDW